MATATAPALPGALPETAELYRVSFSITGPGATGLELLALVEARVREWLAGRSQAPQFDLDAQKGTWSADEYEISIELDSLGDVGYVSFKWECEDRRAPGFWLRLDLDLATEGNHVAVSIESYFLEQDDAEPPDLLAGPPPLVHELLDTFDCFMGDEQLGSGVTLASPEKAPQFAAGRILSPERQLPIVAVSQDGRGETAIDPARLQRVLAGVAVVATYGDPAAQVLRQREHIGPSLACYSGAVRIYWPGCSAGDRSGDHKVWMGREAARLDFRLILQLQGECLRRLAPTFDRGMFESVKWQVDREKLRLRLVELEEASQLQEERGSTAESTARISELEATNAELKRQLASRTQEIKQLREELSHREQSSPSARETERIQEIEQAVVVLESRIEDKDSEIRQLKTEHSVTLRRKEREIEQLRQVFTSNEWVGTGLRLLKSGLCPFVSQKFTDFHGNRTLPELCEVFYDDSHWQDTLRKSDVTEQLFRKMDAAALLKVMSNRWRQAFMKSLDTIGPAEETLVRNLRGCRNNWAHQRNFSAGEAYGALDSMHRLLSAIDSPQAAAVEKLKEDHLKAYPDAQSASRRQAA